MSAATLTRTAPILVGDSLRRIALRELGDALRWIDLATVNQLRPPYIIDSVNPADRQRATLIYGDSIQIPIGKVTDSVQLPVDILGIDCALTKGQLQPNDQGDWALIAAADNLAQALGHRVKTPLGDLLAHPEYGSQIHAILGLKNINVIQIMLIGFTRSALQQDARITGIPYMATSAPGDCICLAAKVMLATQNTPVDLNLVFPLDH